MWKGFEPVYDGESRILILGSFPSVKSREVSFYYGNKSNRMWKILREYFRESFGDKKEEKIAFLKQHRLAMWDVLMYADLKGSSDSDLKVAETAQLSDIEGLLDRTRIDTVFCNGKKSYELLRKYFRLRIPTLLLPSTSPANVSFRKEVWFRAFENYEKEKGQCLWNRRNDI